MTDTPDPRHLARRNRNVLLLALGAFVAMVGLSFASVPLYNIFCRVTGFGGTTQVADETTTRVLDRTMRVRFTADADGALPWRFRADVNEMEVRIGEPAMAYFSAENLADHPVAATAVYNVNPARAGEYFYKVQCFCFDEQVLQPGQRAEFPVYFFIDPALDEDPGLDDVTTVTLSYTFFASGSGTLEPPAEAGYTQDGTQGTTTAMVGLAATQ